MMSLEQGAVPASAPGETPLITDARHPRHAVYAAIARQLPAGTPPETVAQVALQAIVQGIAQPERLCQVAMLGTVAFLQGTMSGERMLVDLHAPALDLQTLSARLAQPSVGAAAADPLQVPR
jgi:hypothetical protein